MALLKSFFNLLRASLSVCFVCGVVVNRSASKDCMHACLRTRLLHTGNNPDLLKGAESELLTRSLRYVIIQGKPTNSHISILRQIDLAQLPSGQPSDGNIMCLRSGVPARQKKAILKESCSANPRSVEALLTSLVTY